MWNLSVPMVSGYHRVHQSQRTLIHAFRVLTMPLMGQRVTQIVEETALTNAVSTRNATQIETAQLVAARTFLQHLPNGQLVYQIMEAKI